MVTTKHLERRLSLIDFEYLQNVPKLLETGKVSINEIREKAGLSPIPEGDVKLIPIETQSDNNPL